MASHSGSIDLPLFLPTLFVGGYLTPSVVPFESDTSNAFDGLDLGGTGVALIEVAVVAPPVGVVPPPRVAKAIAFGLPSLVKGRPADAEYAGMRAVSRPGGVPRVLMGGRDITWFRADAASDTPTRVAGFTNTEPFAYGSAQQLVIPRTNSLLEPYGSGDLAFLHKGARVQFQRILEDDSIVTDYRGVVLSVRSSGREWVAEIGGEVTGRASLIDKQPPLIRKVYDLGSLMYFATREIGLHFTRPTTNLTAPNGGGVTLLGWMQQLGALSRTALVNQRALMPTTWGGTEWAWAPIDKTTVDFTVFADGQRVVLDLVDDVAEQPNTIYGNGVTTQGERWRGAKYPGFFQGTPPPYPFDDDSDFGTGTTDADTDTGDGISVMVKKLAWTGYLNDAHADVTTFDVYVARAVLHLQEDAGVTADGVMTPETWLALWDADVVPLSFEGSRIFPIAQATRVRSWNYSSTGAILGRNPLHQPGAIRVDRTIDFGVCDEDTAIEYARGIVHTTEGHQWSGTITLNDISVFEGEHDDADWDTLTGADILPAASIRPGMNAWLPYFDGGTLLHVAAVDVNGDTVTLTVSTAGLDVFDLTQALKRNAESKRNIYREWRRDNLGFKPPAHFVTHDKTFGKLFVNRELLGNQWNVTKVVAGQSGTVALSDIRLDTATEFYYAVFSREVTETGMNSFFGDPSSFDGDDLTIWEQERVQPFFENGLIRFVKGRGDQPCGYGWRKGYGIDPETGSPVRTANPLTGTDLDASSWNYITDPTGEPVLYLAIWPVSDCVLKRGHLFYVLEDDVT